MKLLALRGFPVVEPGDDLVGLICTSALQNDFTIANGDLLVIAQKIVSKSENRYARLAEVIPSARAIELAPHVDKDPRLVELILRESTEVLRTRPGALIVRHRNGYVHANAGIDQSNITSDPDNPRVLLLPYDPDASAKKLRDGIAERGVVDAHLTL